MPVLREEMQIDSAEVINTCHPPYINMMRASARKNAAETKSKSSM